VIFCHCDVRDYQGLASAIRQMKPEVVFHLAGQVAMTTSIERPALDFGTNALGTFHLLEAVREFAPEALVVYSSTNKVYGDLEWVEFEERESRYVAPAYPFGFGEDTPLDFRSPYGCSKGSADQYMLEYARCFGLRTVVLRHSSIFGDRQFSTFDQGWIGWFVAKGLEIRDGLLRIPFAIAGNGKQVRDVLFSNDLVTCYQSVVEHSDRAVGEAFNIGGGMVNSLSLLELFRCLEGQLGIRMAFESGPARASDQRVFVADIRKAENLLGWQPKVDKMEGLARMVKWVESSRTK
jgi:CDP-paratose 2-epimerase